MIVTNSASISGTGTINVNYDASDNITVPAVPYLCSVPAGNC
jgi:hypothetical protein